MIRYRVKGQKLPYTIVFEEGIPNSGAFYEVLLPCKLVVDPDDDFRSFRDVDSISTLKTTNFIHDHECHHFKIDGTINGKVSKDSFTSIYQMFGKYNTKRVSDGLLTWISSSGSGPCHNRYDTNYTIMAPGILDFASVTNRYVFDSEPFYSKACDISTNSYRVEYLSRGSYVFTRYGARVRYNALGVAESGSVGASYSIILAGFERYQTRWSYTYPMNGSYVGSKIVSVAEAYLYNPEAFFTGQEAKLKPSLVERFVTTVSETTFCRSPVSGDLRTSYIDPAVVSKVSQLLTTYVQTALASIEDPPHVWSDMCVEAIQQCSQVDINSIAFARDIVGLREEITSLKQLVTGYKKPRTWLHAFLASKYGLPLTISDTKELVKALLKSTQGLKEELDTYGNAYQVVRSRRSDTPDTNYRSFSNFSRSYHYKIYYVPVDDRLLNAIRARMDWDIWPTLGNDWDLIPLSFVADWVVDVGGLCERLDACVYAQYLNVKSVLYSCKISGDVSIDLSEFGIEHVKFTATKYDRAFKSQLDLPSFRLELTEPNLSHLPELAAIIALLT